MNQTEKLVKIKSIIDSCENYNQLLSCFSFVKRNEFFTDELYRWKTLIAIQEKAYKMRNDDLKSNEFMCDKRTKSFNQES